MDKDNIFSYKIGKARISNHVIPLLHHLFSGGQTLTRWSSRRVCPASLDICSVGQTKITTIWRRCQSRAVWRVLAIDCKQGAWAESPPGQQVSPMCGLDTHMCTGLYTQILQTCQKLPRDTHAPIRCFCFNYFSIFYIHSHLNNFSTIF